MNGSVQGRVLAVCISEKKGTVKKNVDCCRLLEEHGLLGDAHAGSARQVSLLSAEQVEEFRQRSKGVVELPPGVFGENLLVEGFDFKTFPVGTRFRIGEVLLELTQIGKSCHTGCEIAQKTGECIMPREGVFARVLQGGYVRTGDPVEVEPLTEENTETALSGTDPEAVSSGKGLEADSPGTDPETVSSGKDTESFSSGKAGQKDNGNNSGAEKKSPFRAAVLTASDRSFRGEREDLSGPKIAELLRKAGYEVTAQLLLPDDEQGLAEALIRLSDEDRPDVIFTTGGTGFSPRDRMPEATKQVAEREVPGIAEAIRAYSMQITPRAMLSRAVSVIRGGTLIVNLPGSPKAVAECLEFLLPVLEHGLGILRGEADN